MKLPAKFKVDTRIPVPASLVIDAGGPVEGKLVPHTRTVRWVGLTRVIEFKTTFIRKKDL